MTENIIKICNDILEDYVFKMPEYELRGILNSEMLLICGVINATKPDFILESGLARGHSTEILARNFPEIPIQTLEYKSDEDTEYAKKKLEIYDNVQINMMDAFKFPIKEFRNDPKKFIAIIDGPKGKDAIKLAQEWFLEPGCLGVFMHDFHSNAPERAELEEAFPWVMYSDDESFVSEFKYLDEPCWSKMDKTQMAPYLRHGKPMTSYGSTLAVIL